MCFNGNAWKNSTEKTYVLLINSIKLKPYAFLLKPFIKRKKLKLIYKAFNLFVFYQARRAYMMLFFLKKSIQLKKNIYTNGKHMVFH